MIKMAPEKMPAAPMPAIARPTINVTESGAIPQISEPSSKSEIAERNIHFKA